MGLFDRIVSQPTEDKPNAIVAAASRIVPGDREATKALKRRQEWQTEAWEFFDVVGEVKYGANFVGDALSRVNLYVGWRPDPKSDPEPLPEDFDEATREAAEDALARIEGDQGGHGHIMREFGIGLTVPGEAYLVSRGEGDDESWEVLSTDEIEADSQGRVKVKKHPGDQGKRLDSKAFVGRIWRPHARFSEMADSPLRGVLSSCEDILMIERSRRSTLRSRIAGAGLLMIPEELTFGGPHPTTDDSDGEATDDPFLASLMDAMVTAIQDEGAASATVPVVIRGPGDLLDKVRRVSLASDLDPKLQEMLESALRRLAQGIDLPPEILTGMADVNHWTAWMIDDSTWEMHLDPKAEAICNGLTAVYLRPELTARGIDPSKLVVWYERNQSRGVADVEDNAVRGHERGVITDEALRRSLGFSKDDAPDTLDPAVQTALQLVRAAPSLIAEPGLPVLVGQIRDVTSGAGVQLPDPEDMPDGAPEGDDEVMPEPDRPAPEAPASSNGHRTALVAAPSDLGARLADVDRALADRLHGAADQAMRRAMEKAGARVRSKASGNRTALDAVRHVDNELVTATLGPSVVQALGVEEQQLVADAFDQFGERFDRWVAAAQATARDELADAGAAPDTLSRLEAEQDDDRRTAWTWLRDALIGAALGLLFSPQPTDVDGEFDPDASVPFGTIRESLARAGGAGNATQLRGAVKDAATALRARGVASGVRVINTLTDLGFTERALRWDYRPGIPRETFGPHLSLHNRTFDSPDDPSLSHAGWPSGPYRPGDHPGCRCTFVPVLAAPADAGE